jgi:PAS domain S-box-containing protein
MSTPLRILHLEDSPDDVELVERALAQQGVPCTIEVVGSRADFERALEATAHDLILSDYRLTGFDGAEALRIAGRRAPELPFILVADTIGEEAAIEIMLGGAADVVFKERMSRLGPAVRRAIEVAAKRRARRKSEQALQASEEHYRMLFLNNPHPMWIYDRKSLGLLAVNQAAIDLYGYTVEEFLRMTIKDLRPAADVPSLLEHVAKPRSDFSPVAEWRHVRKDGTIMTVEVASHTLPFAGRDAVLVQVHDVTARKQLEAQFRQAQKMEAVGRLAGGVAHDFNNLLTVVLGHSEMLAMRPGLEPDIAEDLSEIEQAGLRAAQLTRQLLAFSRQQVLQLEVVDLNQVVLGMDKMLRRLIGAVDLRIVAGDGLGKVKADQAQIEQVVMNLVINARDAMPTGGRLTIATGNVVLDEAHAAEGDGLSPGPYVRLAVTDDGVGMDGETRARIFEPFFTTKEIGIGTGLGLSTVYGIVKQSGGHIAVHSEVGRGSTFEIHLPRVAEEAVEQASPAAAEPVGGSETILVIEDDALVRKTVTRALRRHGYTVLEAGSHAEAIAAVESRDGEPRIALILSDVVMHGMGIAELTERLRASQSDVPILYMSGYADRAMSHQGVLAPNSAFMQKPFSVQGLLERVRGMLGEDRASAA